MAEQHLATYLNDHLAGSVAGLELLAYLQRMHAGKPLERFLTELRADIESDRQELEALMGGLGIKGSATRKATAWLGEKITQLKLTLDDPSGQALRLLEALEALALGILGKRSLWKALAVVAESSPALKGPDYQRLEHRAEDQYSRVEGARLEAARAALLLGPAQGRKP